MYYLRFFATFTILGRMTLNFSVPLFRRRVRRRPQSGYPVILSRFFETLEIVFDVERPIYIGAEAAAEAISVDGGPLFLEHCIVSSHHKLM